MFHLMVTISSKRSTLEWRLTKTSTGEPTLSKYVANHWPHHSQQLNALLQCNTNYSTALFAPTCCLYITMECVWYWETSTHQQLTPQGPTWLDHTPLKASKVHAHSSAQMSSEPCPSLKFKRNSTLYRKHPPYEFWILRCSALQPFDLPLINFKIMLQKSFRQNKSFKTFLKP